MTHLFVFKCFFAILNTFYKREKYNFLQKYSPSSNFNVRQIKVWIPIISGFYPQKLKGVNTYATKQKPKLKKTINFKTTQWVIFSWLHFLDE